MARIAGVDLPRDKRVEIGLTYIYGIGRPTAAKILEQAGINPDTRIKDLSEDEVGAIRKIIDSEYTVEGDLRREVSLNIKRPHRFTSFLGVLSSCRPYCSTQKRAIRCHLVPRRAMIFKKSRHSSCEDADLSVYKR